MQVPTIGAIKVRGGHRPCKTREGLLLCLARVIPNTILQSAPSYQPKHRRCFDFLADDFSFLLLLFLLLLCFVGGIVSSIPTGCDYGSASGVLTGGFDP